MAEIPRTDLRPRYWERVPMSKMTRAEWEALCDGCGKCCLNKLEDEDSGEVALTRVACRLLDDATCLCSQYPIRHQFVPECIVLTPKTIADNMYWLPRTCASNTLIILTSNLGSQYLAQMTDDQKVEDVEPQVMDVVRGHFRPEFLNRLDEIILFHRLAQEHMAPIVEIQVARVQKLLKDRKITIDLTEAAKKWLGRVGYDPVYGARPLKRAVQRYVQDPLADMILGGKVPDGSTVNIDEGDGALEMVVVA